MTPELKLQFQQKIYELHINSSMGVDEKNISKIYDIVAELHRLARRLYDDVYPVTYVEKMPENDVTEATAELSAKVKAHRPESK
jgi:hypothetical protein